MRKAATVGALWERRYRSRASHWSGIDRSGCHPSQAQPEKMRSPPEGGKRASKEPRGGRWRRSRRCGMRKSGIEVIVAEEVNVKEEEEVVEEERTKKPDRS